MLSAREVNDVSRQTIRLRVAKGIARSALYDTKIATGCPASTSAPAALALSASAPRCFILFDRHVQKNGGSTLSTLMQRLEEHRECTYWGSSLNGIQWTRVMHYMLNLTGGEIRTTPPRLCVDAHIGQPLVRLHHWLPWMGRLETKLRARGVDCRLLRTTRMREPLSYYISFYMWQVRAARSRQSSILQTVEDVDHFVRWVNATPNLQASILLHPSAADFAQRWDGRSQYGPRPLPRRGQGLLIAAARGPDASATPSQQNAMESARVRLAHLLEHFDIVAPLERFDEFLLLVASKLGLRHVQYARIDPSCVHARRAARVRLQDRAACTAFAGVAERCAHWRKACGPAMQGACEAAVQRAAPLDYWLHDLAGQRLQRTIREHDRWAGELAGRTVLSKQILRFRRATAGIWAGGPPAMPQCGVARHGNRSTWRMPSFPDHPCARAPQVIGESVWEDRGFIGRANVLPFSPEPK